MGQGPRDRNAPGLGGTARAKARGAGAQELGRGSGQGGCPAASYKLWPSVLFCFSKTGEATEARFSGGLGGVGVGTGLESVWNRPSSTENTLEAAGVPVAGPVTGLCCRPIREDVSVAHGSGRGGGGGRGCEKHLRGANGQTVTLGGTVKVKQTVSRRSL